MLGPVKPRRLDESITVSLEDLVPASNFYRHLEAKLDLGFVRDWTHDLYAERGRPSIDPVVFFKLQLVMFFEGIRSERKLIETASLNLAHRWYLGYALDEELPDHSSLTRIRQRLGIDIFQRFFEQIVDLCQEAGLVWGRELYFDATKVEANAGIPSLIPRFYHEAKTYVADVFASDVAADGVNPPAVVDDLASGIVQLPTQPSAEESFTTAEPRWQLLEERRLDPKRPSHRGYRRTGDFRVSPTDPDASPMWDWGAIRLGYHDHYVVDGGKQRIILTALVTPADVMESQAMRDLLWRVCFRRKIWPHHVTGDAKYGTTENIVAIEDAGIRAYVPLRDFDHRTPFFGRDRFIYDARHDVYHCPSGQELRFRKHKYTERTRVYQAPAAACNACRLKAQCTDSKGRQVKRSFDEAYLERVRAYHATAEFAKAMRKRQVWVEPLFAEGKAWHGLTRFRLRGLAKVNMEALLIAAGQNLKHLLSHGGWGRRPWPTGAAGLVLPTRSPTLPALI
jgi:transposase